jgi:hypothetical protein
MSGILQNGNVTPGHLVAWVTDGVVGDAGFAFTQTYGRFVSTLAAVNFNATQTDFAINIDLPPGFTRYRVSAVMISGATATLTTSTIGVFTAGSAGGVAVVASGTAVTVNQTTADTVNNIQVFTIVNQNLIAFSSTVLFFRVQNPQGSPALASVSVFYDPLP